MSARCEKSIIMNLFKINVGSNDAFFRILAGLLLLGLVFAGQKILWAWAGAVLLISGVTRRCPVYLLAGINTEKK